VTFYSIQNPNVYQEYTYKKIKSFALHPKKHDYFCALHIQYYFWYTVNLLYLNYSFLLGASEVYHNALTEKYFLVNDNLNLTTMKKAIILTLFLYGLLAGTLIAGTYRVNNKLVNNPTAKIYSDLQAAHDAAYNGDTLMIEGSPDSYNDLICTKRLVIKGPGYYLDENPGISANKLSAKVSSMYLNSGSNGSLIMGIQISWNLSISDDNITVRRCSLGNNESIGNNENITISECILLIYGYNSYFSGSIVTNLVVTNNIIIQPISFQDGSTGVFLNNVFGSEYITIPTGFDVKNNILFTNAKDYVKLPLLPDPDVCYNISIGDQFGTANHNQASVSESALFLGALTESTDGKWQLKEGSPAIAAGEGGINCGAFGGPQPYILSGVPTGPVIYELNVSSYSTNDNKLPITIKVKSY
jgi:hypothetical protein